ncbi:LacI family DNA-binding transcriptional regulator [Convivina intestini]|uniref:LacI family DNA-binding transcriptional regulator n=1 Tax=Convivina intestini TaxID=1505726 RepID=UPI00200D3D80|nr:LacI family DNA-binding transcriptional regulator [Convivina intestini]CAH1851598.1 Catabolite control protein A [Convivina intestini]
MEKKVTIQDIARQAEVAKSTVSRYLNGGSVSPQTRRKIDEIVRKNQYIPNTFAQGLKQEKNRTIGVIVPRLDSMAQVEMLRGLDSANQNDTFLIANIYQDPIRELAAIKKFIAQKVAGLIILTANLTDEIRQTLLDADIPVVLQGQDEPDFARVMMDDQQAGKVVGQYTQTLAPKNVLILNVDSKLDWAVGYERFQGLKAALANIPHQEIITTFKRQTAKLDAAKAMSQQHYDLVIGATDAIAVGAMQAGFELNQQPYYLGFGQSVYSEIVSPELTSFEFNFFETGEQIYDLFQKIRNEANIRPLKIVIPGQLIRRASTKK